MEEQQPTKVVLMANFTKEEVFAVMRAVKSQLPAQSEVAFAVATDHSLEMKLKDIVKDVSEEHAYFKNKQRKSGEIPTGSRQIPDSPPSGER
ncbi:MAG: DUF3783 domain-containing protein [Sphaerochaetaceae bacterium]|nr:DUF3783 domain-containing protein [Sphaerochaetaceae bacterium]